MLPNQNSFVNISNNGDLNVSAKSVAEAKIAIKELKLNKREYALAKREISQQQKLIRAEYTNSVRQKGSKFIGGGGFGRLVRTVQTISRDADRRTLAQELAPLEQHKNAIDCIINAIEQAVLQLEKFIIEKS
jgi:cobalamin biosynthesis Co2+ chelatase CbiK